MMTSQDSSVGSMSNPYAYSQGVRPGKVAGPNPQAPFYEKDAIRLAMLNQQPWMRSQGRKGGLPPTNLRRNLRQVARVGGWDLSGVPGVGKSPNAGWQPVATSSLRVRLNSRLPAMAWRASSGGSSMRAVSGWPSTYRPSASGSRGGPRVRLRTR